MVKRGFWLLGSVTAAVLASSAYFLDETPRQMVPHGALEVPSFTFWGKLFAMLLLAALGVAYLVWRRPVVQAQAILETSPLGAGHQPPALVDWSLYVKTLIVIEALALVGIGLTRVVFRPLSVTDTLGIVASGAIVALVVHLLILARSGSERDQ